MIYHINYQKIFSYSSRSALQSTHTAHSTFFLNYNETTLVIAAELQIPNIPQTDMGIQLPFWKLFRQSSLPWLIPTGRKRQTNKSKNKQRKANMDSFMQWSFLNRAGKEERCDALKAVKISSWVWFSRFLFYVPFITGNNSILSLLNWLKYILI